MSKWPAKRSLFWQHAPFFRLLLPLIAAIICYDYLWLPHHFHPLPLLICCAICFMATALIPKQSASLKLFTFLMLQATVFCMSWWLARNGDIRQRHDWFAANKNIARSYLVKVSGDPAEKDKTWRMQVSMVKAFPDSMGQHVAGNAFLSIYKDSLPIHISKGDLLMVPGDWQPIKNAGNPFEFDYATFCSRKNILHQQFCGRNQIAIYNNNNKNTGYIARCHDFCNRQLDRYVKDTIARGILQAMLLGDEEGFDPALRQAYATTGVIHIVSISGSHVGVLFFVITLLLFWLKGRKGQFIKYFAGLAAVWLYVLMAGAPPSALRAAIMFSIIALSTLADKQSQPLNTLLAAAFILLIANPMWLFTVGFQLSFCAVLSLILFFRPLFYAFPQTTAIGRWLWTAVSASIAAEILTAPLSIYYFHNFPLFFIVANLFAAVLLGIIALTGGMSVIVLCWLPPVAKGIGTGITWMIRFFNYMIVHIQNLSPKSFMFLQINFVELVLCYAIITAVALYLLNQIKRALPVSAGLACTLLALLCVDKYQSLQQHRLVVYNSSRQSIIEEIKGPHYTILGNDSLVNYVTTQAHTGWHAWRPSANKHLPYFHFKGKNILLFNNENLPDIAADFPVDILIADCSLKAYSARQIQSVFHPGMLVASSLQPQWLIRKWRDSCVAINQPFHATATDGAFVLE